MELDESDIFVTQTYGDSKLRTLRLTKSNAQLLCSVWENLVVACSQAKKDKVVDKEFSLGDRIKFTCSTDFPYINFRRWRKPNYNGDSYPSDHGFNLKEEDFDLFEQ